MWRVGRPCRREPHIQLTQGKLVREQGLELEFCEKASETAQDYIRNSRSWGMKKITANLLLSYRMLGPVQEMKEMWVQFLGREDPLEDGLATHSSIHAWRIPWTEDPVIQSMGSQRVGHNWATNAYLLTSVLHALILLRAWSKQPSYLPVDLREAPIPPLPRAISKA